MKIKIELKLELLFHSSIKVLPSFLVTGRNLFFKIL